MGSQFAAAGAVPGGGTAREGTQPQTNPRGGAAREGTADGRPERGPSCELTEAARSVVAQVAEHHPGLLILTVSNGCCEGTAPYLYDKALPPTDAKCVLATDLVSVYVTALMAGSTALPVHYVIDAVQDANSDSFSLESDLGWRLTVRMETA